MSLRLPSLLLLSALLGGCASNAPALNYYLLGGNEPARVQPVDENLPALVLERVSLAEFLEQSGLVMQQGDHRLQVSRTHLWAEGLDVAVPQVLLSSLRQASSDYRYFLRGSDFVPTANYSLRLHLDAFHATDAGDVVASGRYQVVDESAKREVLNRQFSFVDALQGDGYPQAVSQLRQLLDRLARSIVEDLETAR